MGKSLLVLVAAMSALFSAALYADDYPSRSVWGNMIKDANIELN